jgi:hypothetical protein
MMTFIAVSRQWGIRYIYIYIYSSDGFAILLTSTVVPARRKRRQKGNAVSDETVKYSYWDSE